MTLMVFVQMVIPISPNRVVVVPSNDTILPDVCWGSCDTCSQHHQ